MSVCKDSTVRNSTYIILHSSTTTFVLNFKFKPCLVQAISMAREGLYS